MEWVGNVRNPIPATTEARRDLIPQTTSTAFLLQPRTYVVVVQHQPPALRYDMLYGEYGQPTNTI
jgi:hypothetical protein